jgi:hypothetical protein
MNVWRGFRTLRDELVGEVNGEEVEAGRTRRDVRDRKGLIYYRHVR